MTAALGDFVVLPGDGTGAVVPTAGGFALRGGDAHDFASGVRLFSRFALPASGTVRYRLTRLLVPRTVTAEGAWINVGVVWGRDPAALPPGAPTGDVATAGMWTGWRITHANKNAAAAGSNRLRIKTYPDRAAVAPREAKASANFGKGVANDVVLAWGGDLVSLSVPTLGAKAKQSWADEALRVPAAGGPRRMIYGSFAAPALRAGQSWAAPVLLVPAAGGPRLMFYGSSGGAWLVEAVEVTP